jgi:hypothetical protein
MLILFAAPPISADASFSNTSGRACASSTAAAVLAR